jgi:hypothetical protein
MRPCGRGDIYGNLFAHGAARSVILTYEPDGSQNDWQHARVWRAHSPGILPTMPSREDRQRRQMAGPNAGADSWIADGMYELWWDGSRRPAELEGIHVL